MSFINPKTDFAFKKIFGSADSKDILICFLNSILYEGCPAIEDLEFLNPYLPSQLNTMKNSYLELEIRAVINGATNVTIEMQVLNIECFKKRVLYNATKAYSLLFETRKSHDRSTPLIALTIADFKIFDDRETMISRFSFKEKEEGIYPLADELEFVFVELPKFDKTLEELETLTDKWIYFMKTARTLRSVPEELGNVPELRKAFEIANEANLDPDELEDLERREIFIQDQRGAMTKATRIGIEQGIKQGIKQGQVQLIVSLLESRVGREHLSFAFVVRASPLACFIKHASEDARTQRKNAFYQNEMLPVGPLSPEIQTRISQLSAEQLENLGEAVLDLTSVSDLMAKLQTYSRSR